MFIVSDEIQSSAWVLEFVCEKVLRMISFVQPPLFLPWAPDIEFQGSIWNQNHKQSRRPFLYCRYWLLHLVIQNFLMIVNFNAMHLVLPLPPHLSPCSQGNYIWQKFIETSAFFFRSPGHSASVTVVQHSSAIFTKEGSAVTDGHTGGNLSINLPAGLRWKVTGHLGIEGEVKKSIFLIMLYFQCF